MFVFFFFVFKQKTAYEMRISDWSSDVCSSDLLFVDMRAAVHGEFFNTRRKRDRTANERAGTTCRVGNVGGGLIEHAVIKGLQANANILRFHDCSSRIPSNDAKEPKWPAPISAWKPDRPSKIGRAHV